ncbi:phosphoglucomutase/phosphomannomutase, alpha/beta/alpha domain III family protein [Burkholderia thailandensis MSMB121]|uniref:phosphoglucomutase/phosphomannomutase alpha/beta/alpha domain III family protein n=1 Tax=Burkholderia humptydooensis TaxID=430531 RepID=UPI000327F0E5|nr:phosphoglucomutase/phosphomannomutase alpha/beta/alpha domain III family protein [Burkholderia humptydooensis]AGK49821.1 phosphoglucomutase/phosphomannomutase, alpha/beta/alpha domain III family protein [Burkholderia thailandensis MSMB121]ATF33596.1 phosphoglucomutase [Burkholderia thailandensis]KST71671.1 phosphoglucomutase [Burkholderia humptydooensis]
MRMRRSADGWRGLIGSTFTPERAARLAAAIVTAVRAHDGGGPRVVVGYDGRRLGQRAARLVARAAGDAGARAVRIVEHLPTPTASYLVSAGDAELALLVTASHNPPEWNGVKAKGRPGCPLDAELERRADALFDDSERAAGGARFGEPPGEPPGEPSGKADEARADDARGPGDAIFEECDASPWIDRHVAHVLSRLPATPERPLRVVVDGLGGIAGGAMLRLCGALRWSATPLGCTPSATFGGVAPDPSLPASRRRAADAVRTGRADLGLVVDGDGDRVYAIDGDGRTVEPHELFALLLAHRHRRRYGHPERGIAITAATGALVRRMCAQWSRPVVELPVGFKHLSPLLVDGRIDAGAGGVGDLAFAEFGVDRDPFGAVALLADLLATSGQPLASLVAGLRRRYGRFDWLESRVDGNATAPQLRAAGRRALERCGFDARAARITTVDGVKFSLDSGEWLLLRPSTTEGGIRVYGELLSARAAGAAAALAAHVARALAAERSP